MRLTMASRLVKVGFIFAAIGALLTLRLGQFQIIEGPHLAAAAQGEMERTVPIVALRGEILDDKGRLLAIERNATLVYAINPEIKDSVGEATAMSPILKIPVKTLEALFKKKGWYHVVAHGVGLDAVHALQSLFLPGIGYTPESIRSYPEGAAAEPVLGFVNSAQTGVAGIEQSQNALLSGTPGSEHLAVDALGQPIPSFGGTILPPVPGTSLVLTVDATIQAYAQADIDAAVQADHALSGRIIVMDPQTAAVLAMVQSPNYNPSSWQGSPALALVNQSVQYAYPPGSAFKPVTASLALMDHVATTQSTYFDPGSIVIDGIRVYTWKHKGFGKLTFDGIMEQSSDVGFAELALGIGKTRFFQGLQLFHLNRPTGVGLPGEAGGLRPNETRASKLDLGEMGFGQTLTVTPIQLAAAVSAIADGGVWHEPHVLQSTFGPNGKKTIPYASQRIIPVWVSQDVKTAMADVVAVGTGNKAQVPGYSVAGKTGTSSLLLGPSTYIGSFIGFAPVKTPKVLVYVQINNPKGQFYGGDIAAPVFSELMTQVLTYLRIPPDQPTKAVPQTVTVPNLIGIGVPLAESQARLNSLAPTVGGQGDIVTAESPAAGTSVPAGSTLLLTAAGTPLLPGTVPDVMGLTTRSAAVILQKAGYTIWPVGEGVATIQLPAAGSSLKAGSVVKVVFSPP